MGNSWLAGWWFENIVFLTQMVGQYGDLHHCVNFYLHFCATMGKKKRWVKIRDFVLRQINILSFHIKELAFFLVWKVQLSCPPKKPPNIQFVWPQSDRKTLPLGHPELRWVSRPSGSSPPAPGSVTLEKRALCKTPSGVREMAERTGWNGWLRVWNTVSICFDTILYMFWYYIIYILGYTFGFGFPFPKQMTYYFFKCFWTTTTNQMRWKQWVETSFVSKHLIPFISEICNSSFFGTSTISETTLDSKSASPKLRLKNFWNRLRNCQVRLKNFRLCLRHYCNRLRNRCFLEWRLLPHFILWAGDVNCISEHLPVQEPAALWRSQCCVLCGQVHCYSQCQLWGADCIWHQAGDSEVEWEEPWWVEVEDWEWEEWDAEEEDESDAESVATTVRALKTISAATIIANSAGQGASGRGGSQHSLFWDRLGGVVVATRSILYCLCFYLFLCEALTPQLPPTIMGGAWACRGLRLHAVCVHSFKWCFAFFCFLVFVTCHLSGYYDPASWRLWWFHPPSGDCDWDDNIVWVYIM